MIGNCAEVLPELVRRGFMPDLVTDQTSAHDPLDGYIPEGLVARGGGRRCARATPTATSSAPSRRWPTTCARCSPSRPPGAHVFDYGNNLRAFAEQAGVKNAFDFPGFVPAYIRPLFCEGEGPFRWVALSGDPADIRVTDRALLRGCSPRRTRWCAG